METKTQETDQSPSLKRMVRRCACGQSLQDWETECADCEYEHDQKVILSRKDWTLLAEVMRSLTWGKESSNAWWRLYKRVTTRKSPNGPDQRPGKQPKP